MKILISGASGLIGAALIRSFTAPASRANPEEMPGAGSLAPDLPSRRPGLDEGNEIVRLVRNPATAVSGDVLWDPQAGKIDSTGLEGIDAVVHLAGENVAAGRWNAAKKERIRSSRVDGTRLLCQTLARLTRPPRVLASASAIGYYGDRNDEDLDERSPSGGGFLAGVCRDWEAATEPAAGAGIRVVRMRFGAVLSPLGGAMAALIPIFRAGLGGRLGSGRQYFSWVTLDDALAAIRFALQGDSLDGPINVTSPEPVTNRRFTDALGHALHRPTIFPVPAFVLRATLGAMADEMLLSSARVLPRKLLGAGFAFGDTAIQPALTRLWESRRSIARGRG
ncbi:MAG: TIGR01777 family oxidoreductase [Thermoguttaceae bacterium]